MGAAQATQRGETWIEIGTIESERLLIHSQPFPWIEDGTPLILQMAVSLEDQDQNLATLGRLLIIGSSLAVIVAFGIGWLLAGVTLRPTNRLRQTAQRRRHGGARSGQGLRRKVRHPDRGSLYQRRPLPRNRSRTGQFPVNPPLLP